VFHVAQLNYNRFTPTGQATIVVSRPEFLSGLLTTLRHASMSYHSLQFKPVSVDLDIAMQMRPRTRGFRGRTEAALRGALTGDGPGGGIPERGRAVLVSGLPNKFRRHLLAMFLEKAYRNRGITIGETIARIERDTDEKAFTARALIRMRTTTDAHRLVRLLHSTPYDPEHYGDRYEMRAQIVY